MEEKEEIVQNTENNLPKKTNSPALISFICSLVALVIAGLPLGIVAVITGIIGLTSFKPATEKNRWMAIVGLVLGIIDIICVVFFMAIIKNS